MNPIITGVNDNFSEHDIKDYVLRKCRDHLSEKRAHAFVFIVYDHSNANIKKVLSDEHYWEALDSISGKRLTVFYVDSQNTYYEKRHQEIYQEDLKRKTAAEKEGLKKGILFMMEPVFKKPTPLEQSLVILKKDFQIDNNIKHPFLFFFQADGENVTDSFIVNVESTKVDETYLEIKEILKLAVNALASVQSENLENYEQLFNLIKGGVIDGRKMNMIKSNIGVVPFIRIFGWLKSFHGF